MSENISLLFVVALGGFILLFGIISIAIVRWRVRLAQDEQTSEVLYPKLQKLAQRLEQQGDSASITFLPADAEQEIRDILVDGKKIVAIKRVRTITGWGLKEAKDYVEALQMGMPVEPLAQPGNSRGDVPPPVLDPEGHNQEYATYR